MHAYKLHIKILQVGGNTYIRVTMCDTCCFIKPSQVVPQPHCLPPHTLKDQQLAFIESRPESPDYLLLFCPYM